MNTALSPVIPIVLKLSLALVVGSCCRISRINADTKKKLITVVPTWTHIHSKGLSLSQPRLAIVVDSCYGAQIQKKTLQRRFMNFGVHLDHRYYCERTSHPRVKTSRRRSCRARWYLFSRVPPQLTPVFRISIHHFLQNATTILCSPFGGIGARHLSRTHWRQVPGRNSPHHRVAPIN